MSGSPTRSAQVALLIRRRTSCDWQEKYCRTGTLLNPGGRVPVAPLEATNGMNDYRLSPVFPNPDSMSPGISQEARRYRLIKKSPNPMRVL